MKQFGGALLQTALTAHTSRLVVLLEPIRMPRARRQHFNRFVESRVFGTLARNPVDTELARGGW